MIKNKKPKLSFSMSFSFALLFHLVVLFFVKKNSIDYNLTFLKKRNKLSFNNIKIISRDEIAQLKRVGIKDGQKKDYFRPDILKNPPPLGLSLNNLTPNLPAPKPTKKSNEYKEKTFDHSMQDVKTPVSLKIQGGERNIYFNPKKEKTIQSNNDQDNLKQEALNNNSSSNFGPIAQKISNFEIRYERPEGVSEDELNSDEKAYYSFFKRSYANYLSKLYATYDKIIIERPGLEKDFSNKHVLLARIDYDEKGNIILIKILKSSESDNIHYFFEETLKQLNLPNPPKSFIKNNKKFSTYYQIHIN